MPKDKSIQALRKSIDCIDEEILDLLNKRAELVINVGKLKSAETRDFHVPSREREIFERLTTKNSGPFPNEGLKSVFREIIWLPLRLKRR